MNVTNKTWVCGGARDLPLADDDTWDGDTAARSLFTAAGFDTDSPDPAQAAQGFLVHDDAAPELRGSYKLPFARSVKGKLTASRAGLIAARQRLPQTDGLSPEAKAHAAGVIDHYLGKPGASGKPKAADMLFEKQFESELVTPAEIPAALQAQINRHAGEEVPPDEIMVRYANLANDRYDRSHERFPPEVLERFAETIGGKSVLPGHDRTAIPIGVWLKGEVLRDDAGTHQLRVPLYMDKRSPEGRKVRLGIAKQTSISFKAGGRTCDLCQDEYDGANGCPNGHRKGQSYDGRLCTVTYSGDLQKYEALEGSLVWLGCQYGAEVTAAKMLDPYGGHELKSPSQSFVIPAVVANTSLTTAVSSGSSHVILSTNPGDSPGTGTATPANRSAPAADESVTKSAPHDEEKRMPEEIDELRAKVAEHETTLQAKALEIKTLAELAEDGKAYREHLRAEIARKVSAAATADPAIAEAKAKTILDTLANANLDTLKQWDALAQADFDQKFPPGMQSKQMGEGSVPAPPAKETLAPEAGTALKFDPRASLRRA